MKYIFNIIDFQGEKESFHTAYTVYGWLLHVCTDTDADTVH